MQNAPSERTRRFLLAILPIGVVLLVTWIVDTLASIAVGAELSLVSSILGLISSLILIATGLSYRSALRRE